MKFLTKQDWETVLTKLYMNKSKLISQGQNKESQTSDRIEKIILDISKIIHDICKENKLSHTIHGISMTFFHYYICFNEIRRIDNKIELAFACFFMATKVQFLNFKLKDLISIYNNYIKDKPYYDKKPEPDFIKYEIQLYSLLGYDLDIETPYQMFYSLIQNLFNKYPMIKDPEKNKIKNFCFNLIDDTYTRPLCIYFHPKIIYLSCLIFTFKFLEFNEINVEKIVEGENLDLIAECMENINDIYSKYLENN